MVEVLYCARCGVRMPVGRGPGEACGSCGYVPEGDASEDGGRERSSTRATSARSSASRNRGQRAQSDAAGPNATVFAVAAGAGLFVAIAVALLLRSESGSTAPVPVPATEPVPALAVPVLQTPVEPVTAPPAAPAPVVAGGGDDDDDFFAKLRAESEERRMKTIGRWTPAEMSKTWKPMEWDITEHLKRAGRVGVTFSYLKGAHRLDIQWAALLEDGREISRDAHHGVTGGRHDRNTYELDLPALRPGARYVLQASVRSDGGTDSGGEIRLRTLPPGRAR